MKISLYQRLSLSLLILFIAVAGVFFWWSQNLENLSRSEAEQRLHISLAEHLAQDNPQLKEGAYDHAALQNMFHTLMVLGPSFEFYFINPQGKIITYSAEPGKVKREYVDIKPIRQLIDNTQALPIFGDDPRSVNRKKIFSVTPIYNKAELTGYLYVIIGGEIYDSIFSSIQSNQQLAQSIGLVSGAVVFFFIVLLGLLRFLTLPLKELTHDIRTFRQADFDKSKIELRDWPNADNNEIHELGKSFNNMAEQINQQLAQLQNNDSQRKELLTHLSHDLRTPLASLQGYLETIELKGKELSDEQHSRFIRIAFKNASHLKQLVDQIFELAHLEGGQVKLDIQVFPIAELLHDITAKFSLELEEKHLVLSIKPSQCESLVRSDIGKLERILTNIIENAIRHSKVNGLISIKVSEISENRIELEVTDNGTGISETDLPHIFEARYRGSNAIDDKSMHTGLGLAISQKLANYLGSSIQATSEVGQKTVFRLQLEQSK